MRAEGAFPAVCGRKAWGATGVDVTEFLLVPSPWFSKRPPPAELCSAPLPQSQLQILESLHRHATCSAQFLGTAAWVAVASQSRC